MHLWNLPTLAPVLLGYYRLSESAAFSVDFMLFELIMFSVLYLMTRGLLFMRILKMTEATRNASDHFNYLSQESDNWVQSKCLRKCLSISDLALNEYDSLLVHFDDLQNQPSRKVCLQRFPDVELLRKMSVQESFLCLKNVVSDTIFDEARRVVNESKLSRLTSRLFGKLRPNHTS